MQKRRMQSLGGECILADTFFDYRVLRLAHGVNPEHRGAFLFFLANGVAAHELVHTTGGVHKFLLTGEEGVRCAGDFQLNQRIGHAIPNPIYSYIYKAWIALQKYENLVKYT